MCERDSDTKNEEADIMWLIDERESLKIAKTNKLYNKSVKMHVFMTSVLLLVLVSNGFD